jgi:cytochrome oxidase assembly protein ShyY1
MRIRFRFRWIPFVAAALAVALGVSLGQWQLRRADEKRAIEAKLLARETAPPIALGSALLAAGQVEQLEQLEYRRVTVRGEFNPGWTVYLDNRPYKGMAGLHVLTPLKIAGSDTYVLVARGWLPRDPANRTKVRAFETPHGTIQVTGLARLHAGHLLQLGTAEALRAGVIVQNLDLAQFAKASKLAVQPFIVEQTDGVKDGLVRDWARPSAGVDKHLGYAFQWFALAATAFLFYIITGFRGSRRDQAPE